MLTPYTTWDIMASSLLSNASICKTKRRNKSRQHKTGPPYTKTAFTFQNALPSHCFLVNLGRHLPMVKVEIQILYFQLCSFTLLWPCCESCPAQGSQDSYYTCCFEQTKLKGVSQCWDIEIGEICHYPLFKSSVKHLLKSTQKCTNQTWKPRSCGHTNHSGPS